LINQQHGELQSHSAGEHPNTLVNRMAHSIGFYAARTYLGIQNITHLTREEADRLDQRKTKQIEPSDQSAQPSEQESAQATSPAKEEHPSRTSRAEAMIDDLAQRLSSFTAMIKLNFQRTTARAREDTEDLWAEAQNIRHHKDQPIMQ
jgi:hypothetical protein